MLLIQVIRLIPFRAADTDHMGTQRVDLSRVIPADIAQTQDKDRGTFHGNDVSHGFPYMLCLVRMVLV